MHHPPTQSQTPLVNTSTHRQGSALVLAMVMVVLLVMLGASYLQMARMDRRAGAAIDTRANIDENSILRYIGQILGGDVPLDGSAAEPENYDYPWSNSASPWTVPDRFAPVIVPGPQPNLTASPPDLIAREPRASGNLIDTAGNLQAQGGQGDDTWLASTEPDFSGATPIWPHITNLTGVFVDLSDVAMAHDNTPGGTRPMPAQYLSTADNNLNSGDTDLDLTAMQNEMVLNGLSLNKGTRFADADGDGIADSRWTWAPLPSEAGRAYVMAVRIVDNSALINVNAWSPSTTDAPRWLWPGELDLDASMQSVVTAAGVGSATVATPIWDHRLSTPGAPTTFDERYYNWLNADNNASNLAARQYLGTLLERNGQQAATPGVPTGGENIPLPNLGNGRTYQRYTTRQDEIELRWRNGLNRSTGNVAEDPSTTLETEDIVLFRTTTPTAVEKAYDDTPYGVGPFPAAAQPFFENEPRKQITTHSGSADFGKINLNTADLDDIADVFENSVPAVVANQSKLFQDGTWTDEQAFGDQAAAILADWRDDDNGDVELTEVNGMYGMEYLPFISEVYAQVRFGTVAITPSPDSIIPHTAVWSNPADIAAVIEMVNPWPWRIAIPDVQVWVGDENWGELSTLITKPAASNFLEPNEIIKLERPDTDPTANTNLPNGGNAAAVSGNGWAEPITGPTAVWPTNATPDAIEVTLRVNASSGPPVIYQRFLTEELPTTLTDNYDPATPDPTPTVTAPGFHAFTSRGTGNGLSAMTVNGMATGGEVVVERLPIDAAADPNNQTQRVQITTPPTITTNTLDAHIKNKGFDFRVNDDVFIAPQPGFTPEPFTIANTDRIHRAGDIFRMVFIGPRDDGTGTGTIETVAEVWEKFALANGLPGPPVYSVASAMIDLSDSAKVGTGNFALNQAAFLLNRFTTLDTGLIPGRLNLNTATQRTIEAAIPIVGIGLGIVNARNNIPGNRAPAITARTAPHLTSIAEVGPALTPGLHNLVADFNEADQELGPAAHAADGFTNDREEQTMVLSYLNQVASVRSDVFTAYILVRAYDANDFSTAPLDEWRLLAVFDRSNIGGTRTMPRIIAVAKFEDAP